MSQANISAVQRVAELFEDCRALHRESYPRSLLDFDRLDLTARITHENWAHAKGHFSDVYKGNMDHETVVAVKMLRLPVYSIYNDNVYRATLLRFFREMNIWGALDHTNVAPFLGYTLARGNLSLISPWHDKGNLVEFLQRSPGASEPDLILDIAEGTQYLHTCRNSLVHGDIKGANILVTEHGIACLADFGISKQIDDMNRQTGFTTTTGVTGTIPWMAPELTRGSALTPSCDVYSCAGVFLEICCPGKTPYHYLRQAWELLRAKDVGAPPDLLAYPEMGSKTALWEIMCACWSPDPSDRPRITDLVQSLYTLFKRTPRVNQVVNLRPSGNSQHNQKFRSAMRRPRVDSTEPDSILPEARFKRQTRQRSDFELGASASERIALPMGLSSPSSPPPTIGSSNASSLIGPLDADDPNGELMMSQLMDMYLEDIPVNHSEQGNDWHAISNPQAACSLDISLAMTLTLDRPILCIQLSLDGKSLATGCNQVAHIYDTGTGQNTCILAHENPEWQGYYPDVNSVSFSPDGRLLVTGADDSRLRIWDLATGKIRTIFNGHTGWVMSVAFSPDGSKVISGSCDGTCRIWTLQTGHAIVLNRNGADIDSVAFSPNGLLVAAGYDDRVVRIWDTLTGELVEELGGHTNSVVSVSFTPDGRNLISGSFNGTVKIWGLRLLLDSRPRAATLPKGGLVALGRHTAIREPRETGSRCIATFLGPEYSIIWSVAAFHNGSWVVAGSDDGTVTFWDMRNLETPQLTLQGHQDGVRSADMGPPLIPGTSGGLLATGSDDGSVRIWRYNCV